MSVLRWSGLIVGTLGLAVVFALFRSGRIRRFDFAAGFFVSAGLVTVSLSPATVGILRDMLSLKRDQFSRLIAIAIASNVLVWMLLLYTRFRLAVRDEQFDRLVRRLGVMEFRREYAGIDAMPPVVVVIPAYEEEDNVGPVLEAMPRSVCGKELVALVVDDGSRDRTYEIARGAGAFAVRSPIRRGGGAALRLGFDIAREHAAEIVVTMDADGQHLPSEIDRLVEPIVAGDAAFVVGSRILGTREKDSVVRYLGIRVFNGLIRLLTSARVTDCTNGFRAFRLDELSRLMLRQDQFHTSELIIDAAKRGIRIAEVPVTVRRRQSGLSKKGGPWSYGLAFVKTVFKTWWR